MFVSTLVDVQINSSVPADSQAASGHHLVNVITVIRLTSDVPVVLTSINVDDHTSSRHTLFFTVFPNIARRLLADVLIHH